MGSTIHESIAAAVSSWPGVTTRRHRFGGTEFRVGNRELGHVHGNRLADLPFPLLVRNELIAAGRAEPHHIHPDSGWVSVHISGEEDMPRVVEFLYGLALPSDGEPGVARYPARVCADIGSDPDTSSRIVRYVPSRA
jgi:luciferase-like monooxygenase